MRRHNNFLRCEQCNKVVFESMREAERVANKNNNRPYACPHGNGYHLTSHTENMAKRKVRERLREPVAANPTMAELEAWAKEARGL